MVPSFHFFASFEDFSLSLILLAPGLSFRILLNTHFPFPQGPHRSCPPPPLISATQIASNGRFPFFSAFERVSFNRAFSFGGKDLCPPQVRMGYYRRMFPIFFPFCFGGVFNTVIRPLKFLLISVFFSFSRFWRITSPTLRFFFATILMEGLHFCPRFVWWVPRT